MHAATAVPRYSVTEGITDGTVNPGRRLLYPRGAPAPAPHPLTGVEHGSCETTQHPELEPIFTELAQRWIDAGLALPGQHDEEWTILTRSPWPAR